MAELYFLIPGTVCNYLEDYSKAVGYMEKAIKLAEDNDPENLPTYLINLGMIKIQKVCSDFRLRYFLFHPADPRGITSGEVYQEFQPIYDIFRRPGAKGCSDHRFRAPPA